MGKVGKPSRQELLKKQYQLIWVAQLFLLFSLILIVGKFTDDDFLVNVGIFVLMACALPYIAAMGFALNNIMLIRKGKKPEECD